MRFMRNLLLCIEGLDFGVGVGVFMMEACGDLGHMVWQQRRSIYLAHSTIENT